MLQQLAEDRKFNPYQFCQRLRTCLPVRSIHIRLLANEALYICGAEDDNVYLIESGCVKILMLCRDGKECLLDICTEGDIVGESCLLCAERMETIIAMTPSVIKAIPRTQFLESIFNNGLVEESLKYLVSKLSDQQQIITHFVTADSEQRLAATLLRLARKLGKRHEGKLWIDERITQEELAGIVGTTRSRVGYFLKRFRTARLIEATSQSFLLINEEMLDEYVQTRV
jgi:CRP/FNR family transcriptional regulator, cyclic AMP receptor protein